MRTIKPKKPRIKYGCDFCRKTLVDATAMEDHEAVCYRNPNRTCYVCSETGIELYPVLGANMGVTEGERTCTACEAAYNAGGKYYLDVKQVSILEAP